jgi:hypothetical protein
MACLARQSHSLCAPAVPEVARLTIRGLRLIRLSVPKLSPQQGQRKAGQLSGFSIVGLAQRTQWHFKPRDDYRALKVSWAKGFVTDEVTPVWVQSK